MRSSSMSAIVMLAGLAALVSATDRPIRRAYTPDYRTRDTDTPNEDPYVSYVRSQSKEKRSARPSNVDRTERLQKSRKRRQ